MKEWLDENLRIIISIFIVTAIALGIYAFSDGPTRMDECLKYGDLKLGDVPAKCIQYFK